MYKMFTCFKTYPVNIKGGWRPLLSFLSRISHCFEKTVKPTDWYRFETRTAKLEIVFSLQRVSGLWRGRVTDDGSPTVNDRLTTIVRRIPTDSRGTFDCRQPTPAAAIDHQGLGSPVITGTSERS